MVINIVWVTDIAAMVWQDGQAVSVPVVLDQLKALVDDASRLTWLDASVSTLPQIGELLGLDAHTLEDAQGVRERPKATRLGSYSFATVYGAGLVKTVTTRGRVALAPVSFYMLPTCLVTVRPGGHFDMQPVIERWQSDPRLVQFGVDGLAQGLLDVVVDQQFEVLQGLDDDAEALIAKLFVDNPDLRELQKQTFMVRREVLELRRVVPPMRDVVATLMRAGEAERSWVIELVSYYEDLNDHVLRATEWLDGLRDLVSSIFETNLALNDNHMNQVMKKLAGWAAIIAVPTLITGWFGMNVPYFGFGTVAGFIGSSVVILAAAVVLWFVMRRKDWI